jgi:disulfide bond formation protein DsbB
VIDFTKARGLAFAFPLALMLGAWGSQYIGGLVPCEMCMWQRWAHESAIGLAALSFLLPKRGLVALAALAILVSGGIGFWHAGIEYGWWEGLTQCSRLGGGSLAEIMSTPLVRCDQAQWTLGPISLAGFNGIFSTLGGLAVLRLLARNRG